jgi:hypothetical protein
MSIEFHRRLAPLSYPTLNPASAPEPGTWVDLSGRSDRELECSEGFIRFEDALRQGARFDVNAGQVLHLYKALGVLRASARGCSAMHEPDPPALRAFDGALHQVRRNFQEMHRLSDSQWLAAFESLRSSAQPGSEQAALAPQEDWSLSPLAGLSSSAWPLDQPAIPSRGEPDAAALSAAFGLARLMGCAVQAAAHLAAAPPQFNALACFSLLFAGAVRHFGDPAAQSDCGAQRAAACIDIAANGLWSAFALLHAAQDPVLSPGNEVRVRRESTLKGLIANALVRDTSEVFKRQGAAHASALELASSMDAQSALGEVVDDLLRAFPGCTSQRELLIALLAQWTQSGDALASVSG